MIFQTTIWFYLLFVDSYIEKVTVCVVDNQDFVNKFVHFSTEKYQHKLLNFTTGFSVLNLLSLEENTHSLKRFNKIRDSLKVALTENNILYLQLGTKNSDLTPEELIQWLENVTENKCFQMVHKIVNKQFPEENMLWFCPDSFSTIEAYLANEIQKSITRHYLKRQTVAHHKLIQFGKYLSKKHPQQSYLLKLTLTEIQRMTLIQKEQFTSMIKNYESIFYEQVRKSFIESMQSLQNSKEMKKKKKQKRKLYKKKPSDQNQDENQNQNSQPKLSKEKDDDGHIVESNLQSTQQQMGNEKVQNQESTQISIIKYKQNEGMEINFKEIQNPFQLQAIQLKNNNTQDNPIKQLNKQKQALPEQQTASFLPSEAQSLSVKSKNIVSSRSRERSPYSKSNIVDNQCSKSQLSGEIYETYTQCLRQDDEEQEKNQNQLFEIDIHPLEIHNKNTMSKHHQKQDINNIQEQNQRLKKRKKRKNNQNNSESNIHTEISNKIKAHCHKNYNSTLTNFIDHLSIETNNLYESKIVVFERIRYFIKAFYPESQIMLFGSNSIGLSLASSDVDVMILNIRCGRKEEIKQILAQIAIEINVMAWVVSCSTYLNAKAPLVKLEIDPLISYYETKRKSDYCIYHPQLHDYLDIKDRKKAKNISLDLTISLEPTPYSPSTELMRSYLSSNPLLQRIILIIKYILTNKAYNKNFSGGLGSYCLFIMITAYFQEHPECMNKDEGQVLLDVLKFYSQEFQNLVTSITLRDNASCFISLQESLSMANFSENILSNPLRIIDPLTQKLTSSSCSQYHLIKNQFRRIRTQILAHLQQIHNQVVPNFTQKSMKNECLDKNIQKIVHKSEVRRKGWLKKLIEGKNETR